MSVMSVSKKLKIDLIETQFPLFVRSAISWEYLIQASENFLLAPRILLRFSILRGNSLFYLKETVIDAQKCRLNVSFLHKTTVVFL